MPDNRRHLDTHRFYLSGIRFSQIYSRNIYQRNTADWIHNINFRTGCGCLLYDIDKEQGMERLNPDLTHGKIILYW